MASHYWPPPTVSAAEFRDMLRASEERRRRQSARALLIAVASLSALALAALVYFGNPLAWVALPLTGFLTLLAIGDHKDHK